jgi:hypothetical protein
MLTFYPGRGSFCIKESTHEDNIEIGPRDLRKHGMNEDRERRGSENPTPARLKGHRVVNLSVKMPALVGGRTARIPISWYAPFSGRHPAEVFCRPLPFDREEAASGVENWPTCRKLPIPP